MSSPRVASAMIVAATLVVGGCGGSTPAQRSSGGSTPAASAPASAPVEQPAPPPSSEPAAGSTSAAMPADLPPLPLTPFPTARPMEVVRAVFTFAARHPEVLHHIPCFCGCESQGHHDNDDCFVAARDAQGRVTAWEPHGFG